MKIKTILVEDNPKIRESIGLLLSETFDEIDIIAETDNVKEGEALIREHKPDFVIFDIDIIDGTSFDILQNLKTDGNITFKFIFLTAHSNTENTIKAIKYSANDFLVKPLDAQLRKESTLQVLENIKLKIDQNQNLNLLLELLENPNNLNQRIGIQTARGQIQNVVLRDVVYLKSDGILTKFYFIDGTSLVGYKNIGYYADNLCHDYDFIQIQQGKVINLGYLKSFTPASKKAVMTNGLVLEASRSGTKLLKEYLKDFSPKKLKLGFIKDLLLKLKVL